MRPKAAMAALGLIDSAHVWPLRRKLTLVRPESSINRVGLLRAIDYSRRSDSENEIRIAIQMYEKAVELDPTFALAYGRLSEAHVQMYWFHYDHSGERQALAKQAVDKAFQLNPGLPEVHLALGHYYYRGHLDYDRALEQFAIVRKSQPNNSELLSIIAFIQRRQGKFEQALANLKRASELNPLPFQVGQVALTYMLLRKYPRSRLNVS